MYLVSIACMIVSVVSNVLTFTPSETEWTAPGVEVEELARIDLLAYGESMYRPINRYGTTHLACQAFFVEREDGIKWRVDIVYRDKVVVLEQDREPVEFYPGFNDCRYAIFSPNGRYVMVGAEIGTEYYPECVYTLIDLEEETSIRFQRTFERATEPVFWVSTDGSVAMLAHGRRYEGLDWVPVEIADAPDTLFIYNTDLDQIGFHVTPAGFPLVHRSDDGNTMVLMERGGELVGLDSTGTELWRRHDSSYDGEDSQLYSIRLSGDGRLYLISRKSGVHACDARTGEHLYTKEGFHFNRSLTISSNGISWAGAFDIKAGQDQAEFYNTGYINTFNSQDRSYTILETYAEGGMISVVPRIRFIADNGIKLMSNIDPRTHGIYFYLLNAEGQIQWQTQILSRSKIEFTGNLSPRWWKDYEPNASFSLNNEVYAIAYISENEVIVNTISITQ